ncbi:MAG: PEP-CTERM sorting domain-containing protein [Phycisphaerales bacterium]|nr:PEP-CTERM sorting domain-containing protein [Phycisphaerales bacterium]
MMRKFLATAALAALSGAAFADVWSEVGDAPELLPGQITVGTGDLDEIDGELFGFADLYCIRIVDEAQFSATTVGGASFDTQLWLFDVNGFGVAFNDDSQSTLQSTLTSTFVNTNGIYFLGISAYDYDADSAGGAIWLDGPFGAERAPDGPGAGGALSGWSGTSFADGPYKILLKGASFHVPEPSALALLVLGGLAMVRRR